MCVKRIKSCKTSVIAVLLRVFLSEIFLSAISSIYPFFLSIFQHCSVFHADIRFVWRKKEVFFADTLYYFEHVKILLSVAKSNGNQKLVCLERAYCFVKRNKDNELCVSQSLAFLLLSCSFFLPWKLLSKPGRRGFHKRCRLKVHLATKEKGERECSSLQKQAKLRRRVEAY